MQLPEKPPEQSRPQPNPPPYARALERVCAQLKLLAQTRPFSFAPSGPASFRLRATLASTLQRIDEGDKKEELVTLEHQLFLLNELAAQKELLFALSGALDHPALLRQRLGPSQRARLFLARVASALAALHPHLPSGLPLPASSSALATAFHDEAHCCRAAQQHVDNRQALEELCRRLKLLGLLALGQTLLLLFK